MNSMPQQHQTPLVPPQQAPGQSKPLTCGKCWNWTIQILLLIFMISDTALLIVYTGTGAYVGIGWGTVYIAYLITNFCANSCRYLSNKKDGNNIYQYMGNLYYTPGTINFHIRCYHYETRYHRYRDSNGHYHTRTSRVQVTTFQTSQPFRYKTWRDISGPFVLNTSGHNQNPEMSMVKLHLNEKFEFANDGTLTDFNRQRNHFIRQFQYMDRHYTFTQNNHINGFEAYNLVNLGEKPNPCINLCYYVLWTFLGVVEFYKLYVDSFCIRQEYTITKLMSSRSNLNDPQAFAPYERQVPQIVINQRTTDFNDPNKQCTVGEVPDLPDIEEIGADNGQDDGQDYDCGQYQQAQQQNQQYNQYQPQQQQQGQQYNQQGGMQPSQPAYNQQQQQPQYNQQQQGGMQPSQPAYNQQQQQPQYNQQQQQPQYNQQQQQQPQYNQQQQQPQYNQQGGMQPSQPAENTQNTSQDNSGYNFNSGS